MYHKPVALEFFAGGGMARLGLAQDFDCCFANDVDSRKAESYRANFGDTDLIEADIADLSVSDLPEADLAWASSPCQDVSLAGGRQGLLAKRSGTFWTFWSLMEALTRQGRAPATIVLENVTGLLSSNHGADFRAIVSAFADLGYWVGGLILDAVDFVPQSRARIFLVGYRGRPPAHLITVSTCSYGQTPRLVAMEASLSDNVLAKWVRWNVPPPPPSPVYLEDVLDRTVPEQVWRSEEARDSLLDQMVPAHRARVKDALSDPAWRAGAVYRRMRNGKQCAEVRYDGIAGCLRTLRGGSSRQLLLISENGNLRLRPLLGREAARLMGLPESYRLPISVTAATNLVGDGVCVPLVGWLSTHLLGPLAAYTNAKTRLESFCRTQV